MSNVEGSLGFLDPGGKYWDDGKGESGDSGMGDGIDGRLGSSRGRRRWGDSSGCRGTLAAVEVPEPFLFGEGDLRSTRPRSPDTRLYAGCPIGC